MGLATAPLHGSVSQALFVGERCDYDCVESDDTCFTKLDCVAKTSTIESELVRENEMNQILWKQSRSHATQLITRKNPGPKSAEQSPRSLTKNIFTQCLKEKSVLRDENKRCNGRQSDEVVNNRGSRQNVEEQTS